MSGDGSAAEKEDAGYFAMSHLMLDRVFILEKVLIVVCSFCEGCFLV